MLVTAILQPKGRLSVLQMLELGGSSPGFIWGFYPVSCWSLPSPLMALLTVFQPQGIWTEESNAGI